MSLIKKWDFRPEAEAVRLARVWTLDDFPGLCSGSRLTGKCADDTLILLRRTYRDGSEDFRLLVGIDLEDYSFHVGSGHSIRAAESFSAMQNEPADSLPLLFLDDANGSIIEPVAHFADKTAHLFSGRSDGVRLDGFALPKEAAAAVCEEVDRLSDKALFKQKYSTDSDAPVVLAVGRDGMLSDAKRRWARVKRSGAASKDAPERFVAAELANLHSPHVSFSPVHRLYQGKNAAALMDFFPKCAPTVPLRDAGQNITLLCANGLQTCRVSASLPAVSMAVGILSRFVSAYGGTVVPVPDETELRHLSDTDDRVGILLPPLKKENFFTGIIRDGILPGDSFLLRDRER